MIIRTEDGFIYDMYTEDELKSLHTKQLLKLLRQARTLDWDLRKESQYVVESYISLIKQILSTREHIPNKIESKNNRKMRIKRGV